MIHLGACRTVVRCDAFSRFQAPDEVVLPGTARQGQVLDRQAENGEPLPGDFDRPVAAVFIARIVAGQGRDGLEATRHLDHRGKTCRDRRRDLVE
jgi:hypothetical protein